MTLNKYIRRLSDKLDRNKQRQRKLADKFARLQRGGSQRVLMLYDWTTYTPLKRGMKGKGGKLLPCSTARFSMRSIHRRRLRLIAKLQAAT